MMLNESDDEIIARLATLPLLEYERCREAEAARLGIKRASILDKLVEAKRPQSTTTDGELQGRTMNLAVVEPWPEPVRGADVLSEVAATFSRFVVLPDAAAHALALWVAHAHSFKSFLCSPRLNISSPEKGCGKSTLRDVLAVLAPRPLPTENLSVAVLFRVTQSHRPTLLADECDSWLGDNEDLRGMLTDQSQRQPERILRPRVRNGGEQTSPGIERMRQVKRCSSWQTARVGRNCLHPSHLREAV